MNIPTRLSFSRIIAIIPVVFFIIAESFPNNYLIAGIIFSLASVTDFLDGILARKWNQITPFGSFIDTIADKCLVTGTLITMVATPDLLSGEWGYCGYLLGLIGSIAIITRDAVINGLRMSLASKGKVMSTDFSGKAKTWAIDGALGFLLINGSLQYAPFYWIGIILFLIALALTIYSGTLYLIKYGKTVLE